MLAEAYLVLRLITPDVPEGEGIGFGPMKDKDCLAIVETFRKLNVEAHCLPPRKIFKGRP